MPGRLPCSWQIIPHDIRFAAGISNATQWMWIGCSSTRSFHLGNKKQKRSHGSLWWIIKEDILRILYYQTWTRWFTRTEWAIYALSPPNKDIICLLYISIEYICITNACSDPLSIREPPLSEMSGYLRQYGECSLYSVFVAGIAMTWVG